MQHRSGRNRAPRESVQDAALDDDRDGGRSQTIVVADVLGDPVDDQLVDPVGCGVPQQRHTIRRRTSSKVTLRVIGATVRRPEQGGACCGTGRLLVWWS